MALFEKYYSKRNNIPLLLGLLCKIMIKIIQNSKSVSQVLLITSDDPLMQLVEYLNRSTVIFSVQVTTVKYKSLVQEQFL